MSVLRNIKSMSKNLKKVVSVEAGLPQHWVGDGLPVQSMFNYNNKGKDLNPFVLMDLGVPYQFGPYHKPRGVGMHPHRGFETVTIAWQGEITHKDTSGGGGTIYPGDVQWMTAGSGLMHSEMHSQKFTKEGGTLEMLQLWVNLPSKDKMTKPRYQDISAKEITQVPLPDEAGHVRVIAGDYEGTAGAAKTFTPLNLWDVKLKTGKTAQFGFPNDYVTAIVVRSGTITVNGSRVPARNLAVLSRDGQDLQVEASSDAEFVLMAAEPIDEPVVGYGPFVMNTKKEIIEAFQDFESGKMGVVEEDDY